MPRVVSFVSAGRKNLLASFTLVELLTVIAIIAILAALTLGAASGVMSKAARSRASAEIQAMSTALEGYKTDNGVYPQTNSFPSTNSYSANDGVSVTSPYVYSSQLVYLSLSGQTNFTDIPVAGNKSYMSFKRGQVGDATGGSYVKDPWGNSYGYSTGTTNGSTSPSYPYNGSGFYDLWSTAGLTTSSTNPSLTNTATWISNWQ